MAAAAGTSLTGLEMEVRRKISESLIADYNTVRPIKYKLIFSVEDTELHGEFSYYKESDETGSVLENPCIMIYVKDISRCDNPDIFRSHIYSDKGKPYKCFTPDIEKIINKNSGKAYSNTDIIQVISTKLKLSICPDNALKIIDAARVANQDSFFSLWRLLRGEKGIYEKYGYLSLKCDELREKASRTTFSGLPPYIGKIAAALFPDRYAADKSVSEFMRSVDYNEIKTLTNRFILGTVDKSEICHIYLKDEADDRDNILFNHINLTSLISRELISSEMPPELILDPKSEIWRYWDTKVKFINWILPYESAAYKPPAYPAAATTMTPAEMSRLFDKLGGGRRHRRRTVRRRLSMRSRSRSRSQRR